MITYKAIQLKDGRECILRNGEPEDAIDFMKYFTDSHAETEFLTTYPDETEHNEQMVAAHLRGRKDSSHDIEIVAIVEGKLIGSAGIDMIRDRDKTRHRAEFGITVMKDYWGLGIGNELTAMCVEAAKEAGYLQLELDVVADNEAAQNLYKKQGFIEYGRNPRGFKTRAGKWQELVLMRLELDK